jgi:type II secretory pathway pseudopilin PulG
VTDSWTISDDDRTLTITAAADRREADRLIRIVEGAGLRVMHVALSQVAAAASLGMLDAGVGVQAGFVVDQGQVRFVVSRRGVPVLTRSTPREVAADRTDLARVAGAAYRAAQMDQGGDLPADVSIIADGDDFAAIEPMAQTVGIALRRVVAGATVDLAGDPDSPADVSEYAVPIGAALLAAGLTDRKMDLRGALVQPGGRRSLVRRRFVAALAALVVVGALGLLAAEWIPKRMELARLRRQYEASRPLLQRQTEARRTWELLQPWLSTGQEGERIEHLKILRDITELFPQAADAYVTDMNVNAGRIGEPVDISLTGRTVSSEILYACIGRLNDSGRFDVQSVRLSDVEQALAYPKRYVIPIVTKGAGDDRESP